MVVLIFIFRIFVVNPEGSTIQIHKDITTYIRSSIRSSSVKAGLLTQTTTIGIALDESFQQVDGCRSTSSRSERQCSALSSILRTIHMTQGTTAIDIAIDGCTSTTLVCFADIDQDIASHEGIGTIAATENVLDGSASHRDCRSAFNRSAGITTAIHTGRHLSTFYVDYRIACGTSLITATIDIVNLIGALNVNLRGYDRSIVTTTKDSIDTAAVLDDHLRRLSCRIISSIVTTAIDSRLFISAIRRFRCVDSTITLQAYRLIDMYDHIVLRRTVGIVTTEDTTADGTSSPVALVQIDIDDTIHSRSIVSITQTTAIDITIDDTLIEVHQRLIISIGINSTLGTTTIDIAIDGCHR